MSEIEAEHNRRVSELLAANNVEVERRRAAEAEIEKLRRVVEIAFDNVSAQRASRSAAVSALRRVRQRITGTVVDGCVGSSEPVLQPWLIEVCDGKVIALTEFIDAAIDAAIAALEAESGGA